MSRLTTAYGITDHGEDSASQMAIEMIIMARYSGRCCSTTSFSCGAADKVDARPGEWGVVLGSGRGRELFSLVDQVGPRGRLIGIDPSKGMVDAASASARDQGVTTVEFRRRHLYDTELAANRFDFTISNCVINHASNKDAVFGEAFRLVKPGGRFVVSDICATKAVPSEFANDPDAVAECWGDAITRDAYMETLIAAGFQALEVLDESDPYAKGEIEVCCFTIRGRKPANTGEEYA